MRTSTVCQGALHPPQQHTRDCRARARARLQRRPRLGSGLANVSPDEQRALVERPQRKVNRGLRVRVLVVEVADLQHVCERVGGWSTTPRAGRSAPAPIACPRGSAAVPLRHSPRSLKAPGCANSDRPCALSMHRSSESHPAEMSSSTRQLLAYGPIHSHGCDTPQMQAENTMGRPVLLSAWAMGT